jgi:hypothetical protein
LSDPKPVTIDVTTLTDECLISIYQCCFECDGVRALTEQVVTEAKQRGLIGPEQGDSLTAHGLAVWANVKDDLDDSTDYNNQIDVDLWREVAHWDDAKLIAHLESIRAQSPGSAAEMPNPLPSTRAELVDLLEKLGDGDLDEVI